MMWGEKCVCAPNFFLKITTCHLKLTYSLITNIFCNAWFLTHYCWWFFCFFGRNIIYCCGNIAALCCHVMCEMCVCAPNFFYLIIMWHYSVKTNRNLGLKQSILFFVSFFVFTVKFEALFTVVVILQHFSVKCVVRCMCAPNFF